MIGLDLIAVSQMGPCARLQPDTLQPVLSEWQTYKLVADNGPVVYHRDRDNGNPSRDVTVTKQCHAYRPCYKRYHPGDRQWRDDYPGILLISYVPATHFKVGHP